MEIMEIISQKELMDKQNNVKTITLDMGGLSGENKLSINIDQPIYDADESNCPHLSHKYIVSRTVDSGYTYGTIYADCPRAIVYEQDHCCGEDSMCCLDCILEQLPKPSIERGK